MGNVITKLRIDTDEYQNRLRRATASLSDMGHQCEKAGSAIDTLNKDNLKLVNSLGSMQTVATTIRGKMNELSQAFIDASHHYNQLTAAERKTPYGQALSRSIDQLKVRLREAQKELRGLEAEAAGKSGAGFGSQVMSGLVPGLGAGIGAAGAMLAVKGIHTAIEATSSALKDCVRTNMEFEQANANLASVLGKTRSEITGLTNDAISYGMQTKYTANEVTGLQTNLARLGFTMSEIGASTKPILDLATATGSDLAQAAELAGSTMRSFGLSAAEMERVTSVLAVSTTKSALDMDKLSVGLSYGASVGKQFGFSIEDVTAMLGKLVDAGLPATTAGVGVRNILINLSDKSSKLSKAIGGNVKTLDDFVAALKRMKGKNLNLEDIFEMNDKRISNAFAILTDNADKVRELRDGLKDCGEQARKMADEQMNTLQGSALKMSSAWDALMLTFSNSNGILKDLADGITYLESAIVRARNLQRGGDYAIGALAGGSDEISNMSVEYFQKLRDEGKTSTPKIISDEATAEFERAEKEIKLLKSLQAEFESAMKSQGMGRNIPLENVQKKIEEEGFKSYNELIKAIAKKVDYSKAVDIIKGNANAELNRIAEGDINKDGMLDDLENRRLKINELNEKISEYTVWTKSADEGTRKWAQHAIEGFKAEIDQLNGIFKTDHRGDSLAGDANRIKSEYAKEIADIDKASMSQHEYTDTVYSINRSMYDELIALYDNDVVRKGNYLKQKAQLETKYKSDILRIEVEENKAALEAQAQEQIEQLKKNEMGEREYADAVFEIRKKLIEDLINLYANDPANQSKQKKAMASLGSQHQSSMPKTMNAVYTDYATGIVDVENAMAQLRVILSSTNSELERLWATDKMREYAKQLADITNTEVRQFKEDLGSMQNIWGGITSGVDSVTSAIDTMKSAVDGDANAWEVLCSVIDGTFGVLNSVASITETLNTLTTIGTALEEEHTKSKLQGALASGIKASAEGSLAAAQAGESVAGIPIVGPVLAVAAIGAVAAAIAAAFSKTEYHADGGFVGMQARGTDTVPAMLTPGELVLNRAQQNNLAGQLAGSASTQTVVVTGRISGKDILLAADNTNRSRGGSRGYYAKTH